MCSACDYIECIIATQPLHDREMWHNSHFEPISGMTNESTHGKDLLYGMYVPIYHMQKGLFLFLSPFRNFVLFVAKKE